MVVEHAADGRLGLALGQLELRVLEFDDRLAERLALLDVVDGERAARARSCRRRGRDDQPLLRQVAASAGRSPGLPRVPSRLSAGSFTSSKNSSEVSAPVHAELFELAAAAEARRVVGLDHHQRGALGALGGIGLGDDDDQVGVLAVGDEGLGAVEHIAVARLLQRWCERPAGRSRRPARSWRWRRPVRRSQASAASSSSALRCRNSGCRARRCPNAAARRLQSRPASANSRLMMVSCAKVPPAPPYSSGMAAQSRPASPGLFHAARSMMPFSCHCSMCGTNSPARNLRVCSSSSVRSSVIQEAGGTDKASVGMASSFFHRG